MEPLSPQLPAPPRDPDGEGGVSVLATSSTLGDSSRFAGGGGHHLGDMSLPPDQRKHLMELESSFRVDSDRGESPMLVPGLVELPSGTASGKVGDMGPPPIPVNPPKRRLQRSTSSISTRSSKSSRSVSTSRRFSTTKAELFGITGGDKPEQQQQSVPKSTPSPFLPLPNGDSAGPEELSPITPLPFIDNEPPENFPSSPTVAAQNRNSARGASTLGPAFVPTSRPDALSTPEEIGLAIERRPSARSLRETTSGSMASEPVKSSSASSRSTRIVSSSSANYGNKRRPKFIKSRQSSSQRSSISSIADMNPDFDNDGTSTITAGENGNGIGGGVLSRSTSLGSIASGVTGIAGSGSSIYGDKTTSVSTAAERALARLDEEERNSRRGSEAEALRGRQPALGEYSPEPRTPTDQKPPTLEPTDTVIAAHVKSIHIPPTVTREYTSRIGAPGSPSKRPGATPILAQGKNMTLKEQSFIIDRLQKENFDLKIKVFYLNEKLEKQSDEGIKEMTKENVDMKVKLAEAMRERKALKRRIRELEKKIEEMGGEKDGEQGEETELWELRERVEKYEIEIEELTRRAKEREQKMRDDIGKGQPARVEDVKMLHELLETETARREQVDAENRRLREELWRLRNDPNPSHLSSTHSVTRHSSTTRGGGSERGDRDESCDRGFMNQLRAENDELRREVGAQTSMLTSRNREKERLYQEIEELKLHMRNGANGGSASALGMNDNRSMISDRILDRSVSRAGATSAAGTHVTNLSETERDDYENANGQLRDRISELRLKNQELQIQLETCYRELDSRADEVERIAAEYEEELDLAHSEVQEMQAERNDALRMREEIEMDFEQLKEEAEEEIQRLEEELDIRVGDIERLEDEARMKDEDFKALQGEMRNVSEIVVRLEDAQEEHQGEVRRLEEKIAELQHTINQNKQEINTLENSLREATEKMNLMTVQGESAKGEIAFLREEQDADKIKIGELENVIKSMESAIAIEKERLKETQERLGSERHGREHMGDHRQQDLEKKLNEKNQEVVNVKEEVRRLRGKVSNREDEAKQWRERLEELERALREAMGDLSGTRSGLLKSIVNLQSELESTLEELESTKNALNEKDRVLKDRENLLETMALESRKLTELLDKEKAGRKTDRAALESLQITHQQTRRTISQHQTNLTDLEKARSKDSRTIQQLEQQYREQLAERNNLLTQIWQRLSALCGPDWTQRNSVVQTTTGAGGTTGKQSMETAVVGSLQGFQKNMLCGVKTIESIVAGFKTRCRGVERDLWKEYQVVENALESRTRRLERLENLIRGGIGEQSGMRTEVAKLRTENRLLKAELNVVKNEQATTVPSPTLHRSKTTMAASSSAATTTTTTTTERKHRHRHHREREESKSETNEKADTTVAASAVPAGILARTTSSASAPQLSDSQDVSEKRWILRLRELEKRLKAEREARLLDRSAAKKKVDEARGQREELKAELERERVSKIGS